MRRDTLYGRQVPDTTPQTGQQRAEKIIDNLNAQWHRLRIGFAAMKGRIRRSTEGAQNVRAGHH